MFVSDVEKLAELYEAKYHRALRGKELGQFHPDYKSELGEVLYGTKGIYISKKVYCVKLLVKTLTGELVVDYHIRLKGISPKCIVIKAEKEYNGDAIALY